MKKNQALARFSNEVYQKSHSVMVEDLREAMGYLLLSSLQKDVVDSFIRGKEEYRDDGIQI